MALFISFEGIDGSGKDTQLEHLVSYLRKKDKYNEILVARQPSNRTNCGKELVTMLESHNMNGFHPIQIANLYVQDRIIVSQQYKKFLEEGYNILTSRHDLSTLAYQRTQGISFKELYHMHKYGEEGTLIPNITFLFDLPAIVSFARINKRNEKTEYFEKLEFQEKLRGTYLKSIKEIKKVQPDRQILIINANQSPKEVTAEMISKLESIITV